MVPKFDPKELKVVGETMGSPYVPSLQIFDYPVPAKEGYLALMRREPIWQVISLAEGRIFTPKLLPDNVARAFVIESEMMIPIDGGGPDMFGIEWEYIPMATGSMVRPGEPFMEDANEWYDKLVWPDIDSWDWEGAAKRNNGTFLKDDAFNITWFQTGLYERLISFMDFEGAIMAMVDEDQKPAVKDLFDKISDLYIKIFDKYITYFPAINCFCFHDDWGSQKETFFSPAVAEEMIVPYMRKITDFLHSKGKYCELHSCGMALKQVPNIIAAGWDFWCPQAMNDTHKMYELYGDQMIIGVIPEQFDPATTSEADQRRLAREYADKFCQPGKPSILNYYGGQVLTPAYREELYIRSRENYSK
ncbi:MAG: methyltransferase [Oscillospiraceae bacterium]|nr:methyltransferase [Oscillospiraceae bacterium]